MSKILVIPDIHQDINWVNSIIVNENNNFDKIVLLGDLFDSFKKYPQIESVRGTCKYIMELKQSMGDNLIILVGNHDVPYYGMYHYIKSKRKSPEVPYACSGYTYNKAKDIASVINSDFIASCKLCHIEDGILFSHAGLLSNFIKPFLSDIELIDYIESMCDSVWKGFPYIYSSLLDCGVTRNGNQKNGGITWCDINEFDDSIPLVQIFGHTTELNRVSRIGKSYCIDGLQTVYCIVDGGCEIVFKGNTDTLKYEIRNPIDGGNKIIG